MIILFCLLDTYGKKIERYENYYRSTYDDTAECTPAKIVVINPPARPTLTLPENNTCEYFLSKTPLHSPKFEWSLKSWGWSPTKTDKKVFILTLKKKTGGFSIIKEVEDKNEFKFPGSLSDGDYEWTVTAKLGVYEGLSSESSSFSVCVADTNYCTECLLR